MLRTSVRIAVPADRNTADRDTSDGDDRADQQRASSGCDGLIVIQNAASTSYSDSSSERSRSIHYTPSGLPRAGSSRPPNHIDTPRSAAQASGFGGFVEVSTLNPRWADVRVDGLLPGSVGDHLLERSVHLVAALGVAQLQANAVSLEVETNGLPTTLSLPAYCGCAAKPAKITLSVVTASTVPPTKASTHLE